MSALTNELLNGPLADEIAPYVASGNDGAIYEILNRKDISVKGVLQTKDIQRYLFLNGLLLKIEAKTTETRAMVARALELFPLFTLSNAPDLAMFTNLADALISDTELGFTAQHKADLLAMADTMISRAEQITIPCSIQDIAQALRSE